VYAFSAQDDPIRKKLAERHFDAIYLNGRKMGFISEEFRSLMLEIWRVKYLQMARFTEVIRTIPMEIRLEHFLNDGDSPDIPIPVYVGYLNQIRELAHLGGRIGAHHQTGALSKHSCQKSLPRNADRSDFTQAHLNRLTQAALP
jgi:hypothetical protein